MKMCTLMVILSGLSLAMGSTDQRPNIVILVADDLGYGDLSCFGNTSFSTPHLDRLAAEGVRLTHHLAAAAVCTPSRTALLTGRYPVRSGMQESSGGPPVVRNVFSAGGLPPTERTFGRLLRDAGYRTQFVGKWHQGWSCHSWGDQCHGPRGHGFEGFFGLPFTLQGKVEDPPLRRQRDGPFLRFVMPEILRAREETPAAASRGGGSPRLTATQLWHLWLDMVRSSYYDASPRQEWWGHTYSLDKFLNYILVRDDKVVSWPYQLVGLTQRLVAESERFIRDQAARDGAPFLLVHSFLHPHTPLYTTPAFRNASGHSRYADNVLEMDWAAGRLLAALEETGVADNTLVYFASDHGGQVELVGADGQREGGCNTPFRGGKGQGGVEGGVRVPAVVRWPGRIPAGRTVDLPTSAMDLLPTLLDAAGVSAGENLTLDGISMLPLLEGRSDVPTHRFLAHYCGDSVHAVRYAPEEEPEAVYKLQLAVPRYPDPVVEHCGKLAHLCSCYGESVLWLAEPRLFDVASDPAQRAEIPADDDRYVRNVPEMLALLERHRQRVKVEPSQCGRFELITARPELVPWGQLERFRGVEWDMHGLDDWRAFSAEASAGQCSASGEQDWEQGQCSEGGPAGGGVAGGEG